MYHTNAAYKQKVTEFPQNYRMEIEVIYDAEIEDSLETLQCEDGAPLETETGVALEYPVKVAEKVIIPPDDIFEAGFSENVFLNNFCIGTSVRSDFWVRIFNENGKYRNDALATAEIHPRVTLYDDAGEAVDTVPIGVFYVDPITVQNSDLRLGCYDRMQSLEKPFMPQGVETSLYDLGRRIAATVRANFATTPMNLITNGAARKSILNAKVNDNIFEGYSRRQVIELIAEVCGSFAIFNPDGDLELRWFKKADVKLRGDWANAALELNGNTFSLDGNVVQVTGVRVVYEDTELAHEGTDDYLLTINENPIAAAMPIAAAKAVLYRMRDTRYIPCKWCRIGGDPSLQLGDILTVIDNKTEYNEADYDSYDKYPLYMTARSWTFDGGFSDIYISAGNAETDLNRDRGMTISKRISKLAKRVTEAEKNITEGMTDYEAALLLFNEKMFNAMGLYKTVLDKDGGGVIIYYHDEAELENSRTIYMFGSAGFAWTTGGWSNGEPLWHYGFTDAGDAILNTINAYIVSADLIKTGLLQSQNGASWINMDDGTFCFRAVKDKLMDLDTGEMSYTYEKVLELANKQLNVYGKLRNLNYPNFSVSVGPSNANDYGALTVTDAINGYGDIFQIYPTYWYNESDPDTVTDRGTTITAPFLGTDKGNRRGVQFNSNESILWNEKHLGSALLKGSAAYVSVFRDNINISTDASHGHCWFNYYQPKHGYSPDAYDFGNGAGGHANVLCADIECSRIDCSGQIIGGDTFVGYLRSYGNVNIDGDFLHVDGKVNVGGSYGGNYKLSVVGTACVNGISVTSDPELKDNITEVTNINALGKISKMKFYSYDYKSDATLHVDIGTMAPDSPAEIQSSDGKAIDLYAYINLTTKAVQELSQKLESLEKRISELEAENEALKQ